ncbi:Nramp family divalent metal transporter [Nitrosophilus alvini]|uniref:Nramp family divalent metal transporter n=1 Tax=Nitrosophilus alvini TaxID=2714855 RepID=UPI00190D2F4C|nr:Nramp family divalent metal transporter [Nitrosophilus alvini]
MRKSLKDKIKEDIKKNRERIKKLGPGIITGGAGDDPAGIVTCTVVGATTGFSLLWLAFLSAPMMVAVQDSVSRIAIVTGKSLPEITNSFYGKPFTIFIVLILSVANILTIGADLNAIAVIFKITTNIDSVYFLIPITALIAYLVMFGKYKNVKKIFVVLSLSLSIYILSAFLAKPDFEKVLLGTFIPSLPLHSLFLVAALGYLGTKMSPYLLFWQASEEKEEHRTVMQAKEAELDTTVGMIYSSVLDYFIIVAAAATIYGTGNDIKTVEDAATALKPIAGEYAFLIFSIGIIISGFLAIPVLAGTTAYAIADTFGWREGMDYKVSDAKGFYTVFIGALIIGDIIDLSPISAVDALYYSQVLDGVLLPLLIGLVLLISNDKNIMGKYTNSRFNNIFASATMIITSLLSIVMFSRILF